MTEPNTPEQAALAALRRLHPGWMISRAEDGFVAVHTDPATGRSDDVIRAARVDILDVRLASVARAAGAVR
ncbi:hypothetical protein KIK06_24510 [Nocardiopsis sp. EMB25]|uniref:hypothetical protein n=1 Tax=Nocardiopsis sp. EMB25 TaxID=2835867 RepID=UPI002284ADB3|nr:hypothetical protein [Nocardiopsis sp. EMB25]MCY9787051.1 hypothetical protein [Nocardiopsis sp. EMB25]